MEEERKEVLVGVGAANSDEETNKAFDEYDKKVKPNPPEAVKDDKIAEHTLVYYAFLVLAFAMGAATMLIAGRIVLMV